MELNTQRDVDVLREAQKNAREATALGINVINDMLRQEETLNHAKDTVEASEYVVEKSLKTLRAMTWSGFLYNLLTPIDKANEVESNTTSNGSTAVSVTSSIRNGHSVNQISEYEHNNNHNRNDELDQLHRAVEELKSVSLALGETLSKQNQDIDSIQQTTDRVYDKSLQATLKSSQLLNTKSHKSPTFIGKYQFEYLSGEGLYLSVDKTLSLILTRIQDKSTQFNIYLLYDNIYAMQNEKTLTYVNVTWNSTAQAYSQQFTKSEYIHLELEQGKVTGIFFLNTNWGYGGWLKKTLKSMKTTPTSATSNTIETNPSITDSLSRINDDNNTNNIMTSSVSLPVLYELSWGISDKAHQAIFLPILCTSSPQN